MNDRIYLSAPDVGIREKKAIIEALESGWVAPLGPEVDRFEEELAARVGAKFGVALSSGTSGLHLGLLSLGVKPDDVVITSTMTFVATANAILYTGAKPFFVDSEYSTGNMNPKLLHQAIVDLKKEKKSIAAIVPVDLLGKCANYPEIIEIASKYGIPVLCDAAESLGASLGGRAAGSWGNASIVSFNGNKIITTSGGGMLLTDDSKIAAKVRFLATQAREPKLHYEHKEMGFNYRLSNILAAMGRAQLSRLDAIISKRRQIRSMYKELFAEVPGVEIFQSDEDQNDNCWLTSIVVNSDISGWASIDLIDFLADSNIESRPLWKPMHLQPLFANAMKIEDGTSELLFRRGVTLPSSSAMNSDSIERIRYQLKAFLSSRSGTTG